MSDWQPARLIQPHGWNHPSVPATNALGTIVRIKPIDREIAIAGGHPCRETDQFFSVHPDDVARILQREPHERCVCEHEILTD